MCSAQGGYGPQKAKTGWGDGVKKNSDIKIQKGHST